MTVCTVGLDQFRTDVPRGKFYWNVQVFVDSETQTKFGFMPFVTHGRSHQGQPLILTEEMIEYAKAQAKDVLRRIRENIQKDVLG